MSLFGGKPDSVSYGNTWLNHLTKEMANGLLVGCFGFLLNVQYPLSKSSKLVI